MDAATAHNVTYLVLPAFLVSAGIALYLAVPTTIVALAGHRASLYLSFALICLCAAGYQLATAGYYIAGSVVEAASALHWQVAAMLLFHPAFFAFVALYTGQQRITPWLITTTALFGALLILNFASPHSVRFTTLEMNGMLRLPWGESLARFKGHPGIGNWIAQAAHLAVFVWAISRSVIQYRQGMRRAALFLAAYLPIGIAAGVQGLLVDLGISNVFYTSGFAFLCLAVLMSISMGMELRDRTAALEASTTELGSTIGMLKQEVSDRRRAEDALRHAVEEVEQLKTRIEAEKIYLQGEIKLEHNFDEIIGGAPNFRRILSMVEQVASTDSTVLILGETGTGKELIARAIHHISLRRDRALVKVNCASLPENLIESELFGHEKGAFTGALFRQIGRFELADGGTIFLDEIGDLPRALQAKLLRVLQEGEFERLGQPRTHKVDVRVIAATNRDLAVAVASGTFRNDLYFRLNVFPITIPPLRERKEDIPVLVKHFVSKYAAQLGKEIKTISNASMDKLCAYHWPGNIRELENIIERAVILTTGPTLKLREQLELRPDEPPQQQTARTLREHQQVLIRQALEESRWVIEGARGAAARLAIPPSTLRDWMRKYGIEKQSWQP
jgi:transcriptional regulator with GAF, ATPase, and Fis domain